MAGPYWNDEAQRWENGDEDRPVPPTPQPPPLPRLPPVPPVPPVAPVDPLSPTDTRPPHDPDSPFDPYGPGPGTPALRGRISPLAAGAAVVVLSLGVVTVWFALGNRGGDQERTRADGSSSQVVQSTDSGISTSGTSTADTTAQETVTPDPTDSAEVPAGYRLVEDPEGFSVAVPDDWERSLENDRVFYRTSDRASLVQIFQVTEVGMTPGEAVRLASDGLRGGTEGYEEISVGPAQDGGVDEEEASAELVYEYDSEESGGRRRGVERVFRTSSGDLYALLVAAPAEQWPLQREVLGTAVDHFVPNDQV